jgi:hypothetical protein
MKKLWASNEYYVSIPDSAEVIDPNNIFVYEANKHMAYKIISILFPNCESRVAVEYQGHHAEGHINKMSDLH